MIRQNDYVLLDRWRRGDQAAGKELFERHYDLLYRFFATEMATGQGKLVVETFQACREGRAPLPRHKDFRVHLLAGAHRVLGARFPHHRPSKDRALLDDSEGSDGSDVSDETSSSLPGSTATSDMLADTLSQSEVTTSPDASTGPSDELRRRALQRLPGEMRRLIELCDVERLSEHDIAEILDLPFAAVTRGLAQARWQIERAMEHAAATADTEEALAASSAASASVASGSTGFLGRADPDDEHLPFFVDAAALPPARDAFVRPRERIEIVLAGALAQLDPGMLGRIIEEVRARTGDTGLAIVSIAPGSVILELDASAEAADMLVRLVASGDLQHIAGMRILDIRRVTPALPPATAADTPKRAEAALSDFLVSAFAADELRRFVRGFPDGARLEAALPGALASPSHLASEAVRVLVRHDLIGATLFDRLAAERPQRADEIRRIRERFGAADDAESDSVSH